LVWYFDGGDTQPRSPAEYLASGSSSDES